MAMKSITQVKLILKSNSDSNVYRDKTSEIPVYLIHILRNQEFVSVVASSAFVSSSPFADFLVQPIVISRP